jgi:argininosuccinate lyase
MQEDKERLFDTINTVKDSLKILEKLFKKIRFIPENIEKSLSKGYLNATDLAEYLVIKKIPFREAHNIVGKIVKYCMNKEKKLEELTLKELKSFSELFEEDVLEKINLKNSIFSKDVSGGTGKKSIIFQIEKAERLLKL